MLKNIKKLYVFLVYYKKWNINFDLNNNTGEGDILHCDIHSSLGLVNFLKCFGN